MVFKCDLSPSSFRDCLDFFELHTILSGSWQKQRDPLDAYKIHECDGVGMSTPAHSATAGLYISVLWKGINIVITCKIHSGYQSRTPFPFRANHDNMQPSISLFD